MLPKTTSLSPKPTSPWAHHNRIHHNFVYV
nr:MAG TPA: hypothetical protein [Caudoviricetes sp.]